MIAMPNGGPVIRVRTERKRPDSMKWDAKAIEDIITTPTEPNPHERHQDQPRPERDTHGLDFGVEGGEHLEIPAAQKEEREARDFRITDDVLSKHGYTAGCPRCDHAVRWGWGKTGQHHSPACVRRISEELEKTPKGRARLESARQRTDAWMAQRGEELLAGAEAVAELGTSKTIDRATLVKHVESILK